MIDRDEPPPSFDPRTWGSSSQEEPRGGGDLAKTKPTGASADDLTSFDPKSWLNEQSKDVSASTAQTGGEEKTRLSPRRTPRATILKAGGAAAVLLIAGAGIAFLSRGEDVPEVVAAVPSGDASAPGPAAAASSRTIVLASAAEITPSLLTAGIDPAGAKLAGDQAKAAVGDAPGEIRLEFEFVTAGSAKRLTRLQASRDDGSGILLAAKAEGGFTAEKMEAKLATSVHAIRGEMDGTSFYSSAVTAGVNDSLISDFAKAFSFDFDFQREINQGDVFEAAFEQDVNPSGQSIGPPRLVYASMTTPEKSRRFYRFRAPGQNEPGWFDDNGRSTVRALMRTPVDGARVSSNFGYRTHPILGYQKLHRGTDFAAPTGTPMYAAGAGVVEVAAPRGAAGNFVIIRHDNGWQTRYMHLHRFADGLAPGVRLTQGQQIGEVGTTGRSTGPHLHYEVYIDGEPVDPLSIDTGTGVTLEGDALAAFRKERDRIDLSRSARTE